MFFFFFLRSSSSMSGGDFIHQKESWNEEGEGEREKFA